MKPNDERQPEEQDSQYDELMTLLQKANLNPMLVDPQERAHILSQARARLFPTDPEIFKPEHLAAPLLRELGSFPSKPKTLADKPQRGKRLLHVLNMLAAVLVIAALLGASLLFFQHRLPLTRNHVTNATQTYASFVAKNGIMFGFDAQHTNANPFEQITGQEGGPMNRAGISSDAIGQPGWAPAGRADTWMRATVTTSPGRKPTATPPSSPARPMAMRGCAAIT